MVARGGRMIAAISIGIIIIVAVIIAALAIIYFILKGSPGSRKHWASPRSTRMPGLPQYAPIRSARSKSGSMRTWSRSARAAAYEANWTTRTNATAAPMRAIDQTSSSSSV